MKCGVLSSGEQTRVALAKAMLNQPRLLLLDEPTASLDPVAAKEIRSRIRNFVAACDVGVLWTSHNMYEVQEVCDRVLFLSHGKITPARWIPIFAWVAIDIILWGFITKYLNSVTGSGLNFVPRLLGAVLLFDFFTRVMHGISGVFLEDVWSRSFLNIFATPLTIPQDLLGLVVTTTGTSLVGLLVMLTLATTVFGLSFFHTGWRLYRSC